MKKVFILLFSLLLLTGCSKKTAVDKGVFESIATENNYSIVNSDSSRSNTLETSAVSKNDCIIYYNKYNSESSAKSDFESIKNEYYIEEDYKTTLSTDISNYSIYMVSSDKEYNYVMRIDDTIVNSSSKGNCKKEVYELVNELGYTTKLYKTLGK